MEVRPDHLLGQGRLLRQSTGLTSPLIANRGFHHFLVQIDEHYGACEIVREHGEKIIELQPPQCLGCFIGN